MKYTSSLALVLLASACGGSSGSSPATDDGGVATRGGSDGPVIASGCDHVTALCTKLNECAPFLLKAVYGDVNSCADRLTRVCTEQAGSNGSGMTQTAILACETALKTATCDDVFGNNVSACSFRGMLADGSACGDSSQCQGGFCSTGGTLCGTCASKKGSGAACSSGSNDECQTGLVCSSGKLCVTRAMVGGPCDDSTQPCPTGSFCTSAKTCALTVKPDQIQTAKCPGAYINFADGTFCTGKDAQPGQIVTATKGEPCGLAPSTGQPALCAPGSVAACASTGITILGVPTQGVCTELKGDGFACAATSDCQAGAQCIATTCQIPSGKYCP